jgi:hypothetical protein
MRRFLVALWMPLLMLLTQQAAIAHELSHLRAASSSPRNLPGDKQVAADVLCLSCLAHADLPGLSKADDFRPGLARMVHARPQASVHVARGARALVPRSRGPPAFL